MVSAKAEYLMLYCQPLQRIKRSANLSFLLAKSLLTIFSFSSCARSISYHFKILIR